MVKQDRALLISGPRCSWFFHSTLYKNISRQDSGQKGDCGEGDCRVGARVGLRGFSGSFLGVCFEVWMQRKLDIFTWDSAGSLPSRLVRVEEYKASCHILGISF